MALNRKRASGEGEPRSPQASAHGGNAAFATLLAGAVLAATLTAGGCAYLPSRIALTFFAAGRSQQRLSQALSFGHFPRSSESAR